MEVPLYEGRIQDSYDPPSWVNISIWVGHDKVCSQEWTPNVCVLRFDNWHIQEPGLCNRVKWERGIFSLWPLITLQIVISTLILQLEMTVCVIFNSCLEETNSWSDPITYIPIWPHSFDEIFWPRFPLCCRWAKFNRASFRNLKQSVSWSSAMAPKKPSVKGTDKPPGLGHRFIFGFHLNWIFSQFPTLAVVDITIFFPTNPTNLLT